MLKAFNLLEIFWDYDIIVTITMPSLGYYHALGLYSAGQSTYHYGGQNRTFVDALRENRFIKIIPKIPHMSFVSFKLGSLYCGVD